MTHMLLSDVELWHYVLNSWYVPQSEADAAAFKAEFQLPNSAYEDHMRRSWLRIFDLDWFDEYTAHPRAQKTIQAVFWELHLDQVRHVQHFTAR